MVKMSLHTPAGHTIGLMDDFEQRVVIRMADHFAFKKDYYSASKSYLLALTIFKDRLSNLREARIRLKYGLVLMTINQPNLAFEQFSLAISLVPENSDNLKIALMCAIAKTCPSKQAYDQLNADFANGFRGVDFKVQNAYFLSWMSLILKYTGNISDIETFSNCLQTSYELLESPVRQVMDLFHLVHLRDLSDAESTNDPLGVFINTLNALMRGDSSRAERERIFNRLSAIHCESLEISPFVEIFKDTFRSVIKMIGWYISVIDCKGPFSRDMPSILTSGCPERLARCQRHILHVLDFMNGRSRHFNSENSFCIPNSGLYNYAIDQELITDYRDDVPLRQPDAFLFVQACKLILQNTECCEMREKVKKRLYTVMRHASDSWLLAGATLLLGLMYVGNDCLLSKQILTVSRMTAVRSCNELVLAILNGM